MKRKIFSKIIVVFVIACTVQLIPSCQSDDGAPVSFSNDSLSDIQKMDLSSVGSYDYKNDGSNLLSNAKVVDLKEKLMAYTNSGLKLTEKAGNRSLFKGNENSSAILDINTANGEFLFNKGMENYSGEKNTPSLPSEYEAANVAEEHLKNLELTMDNDKEVAHIGGLNMATLDKFGTASDYQKLVTVTYERKLAGLPVMGASRIVVNLGEQGELAGLVWNWPNISKNNLLGAADAVKKSEIKQLIVNKLKSLYTNLDEKKIVINKIKLVMYDDGEGVVEPALFILGEMISLDGTMKNNTDCLIPVLKKYKAKYPMFQQPPVMPSAVD